MTVQMNSVKSTSISALGYNRRTMKISFKNGKVYEFKDIPRVLFDKFVESTSKGKFFNQKIREVYKCAQLN